MASTGQSISYDLGLFEEIAFNSRPKRLSLVAFNNSPNELLIAFGAQFNGTIPCGAIPPRTIYVFEHKSWGDVLNEQVYASGDSGVGRVIITELYELP